MAYSVFIESCLKLSTQVSFFSASHGVCLVLGIFE